MIRGQMPIYQYLCRPCGRPFKLIRPIVARDEPSKCPNCGASDARRKYSSVPNPARLANDESDNPAPRSGTRRWQVPAVVSTVVLVCGLTVVRLQLLRFWGKWLDNTLAPGTELGGWPILYWGRSGKILEFIAGLTIILDLAGEERVDRWHASAIERLNETVAATRTLFARTLMPWKSRVGKLAWVAVPVACVANGVQVYWLELHVMHFGPTFSLATAALTGLVFGILILLLLTTESFSMTSSTYSLALVVISVIGYIRYGFHVKFLEHPVMVASSTYQ